MIPGSDHAGLGPDHRLEELATLLATAYRRLVLAKQKGLALSADAEPSCDPAVNAAETTIPLKDAV